MDKRAEITGIFGRMLQEPGQSFFTARVVSVGGDVCTINYQGMEISDVRLTATRFKKDNMVLITPAVDSYVVLASHSGDLNNLSVLSVEEIQSIKIICGETTAFLDAENVQIACGETSVVMDTESAKIACGETSALMDKDRITFNDGDNGGMIISGEMSKWMNKVHDDFAQLQTALMNIIVTGNTGMATFSPTTPAPVAKTLINEKVKQ